jgi:hypothetical protein
VGPAGPPSWVGLAIIAAAAVVLPVGFRRGRAAGSRAAFQAVLTVAVADVVLLVVTGTGG